AEASVRVLATLSRVMPPRLARRVDALQSATDAVSWGGPGATVAADALVVLAQACRDAERVEFDYRAATGEESHRTVEPLRLVRLGLRWYLVGYDLRRHDWRCFRLDRLTTPAPTGDRFRPRAVPGGDAAEYVRASVG